MAEMVDGDVSMADLILFSTIKSYHCDSKSTGVTKLEFSLNILLATPVLD